MTDKEKAVLNWLANGETARCSEAMAFWLSFDVLKKDALHPRDPEDFASCLRLLQAAPALRTQLHKLSALSTKWARLVAYWDVLEEAFLAEDGWSRDIIDGSSKTYDLLIAVAWGKYRPSLPPR